MSNIDFQSVDEHMNAVDLSSFDQGGATYSSVANAAKDPSQAISGICDAYKSIKPLLKLLSELPLIPSKWREVIKKFMSVADLLCP